MTGNKDAKELLGGKESNEIIASRILGFAAADAGYDYDDVKGEIRGLSYDGEKLTVEIVPDDFTDDFKGSIESACDNEGISTDTIVWKED